jgi:redox-sensitive bicupin YhaK (pirin superfamily)
MSIRPVRQVSSAQPAIEGAGVHLRRAFGFGREDLTDPFLLFDDFRNDDPKLYSKGFPWHPHRGIETITYVLSGEVDHGDSLGNTGTLGAGDVQWMTAGSGIIHQEMPRGDAAGAMHGFQLWANLPSDKKMTHPRYQDVPAMEIPEVVEDDGTKVRIITGQFWESGVRWRELPPIPVISMLRFLPILCDGSRSICRTRHLPMSSQEAVSFAPLRLPLRHLPNM